MSQSGEGRTKRVATLKKLIIAFLVFGILIPIVLCILLFIKVGQLQRQVDALSAKRANPSEQTEVVLPKQEVMADAGDVQSQSLVRDEMLQSSEQGETAAAPEKPLEELPNTRVYLTFDDGPSSNTEAILDILASYDVKATFFVTGKQQEMYLPLYQRIVEEGHTLGMHSYSHRYGDIYASKEQFAEDLSDLQEFLYDATGVWSRFYRFPGGSSNGVSKVPMEELADYLTEENIYYLDWNVSCGDATGRNLRPQQLADNVTQNVEKYQTAVVLLHDASDKTSTVEALPLIIEKIQSMEKVEFAPVDDEMHMVHHLKE